jgi:cyclopropane fatty-acyl-phospholipid synthase-like methyltransferase
MMKQLESMSDFFTARVNGYDEHMLRDVEGCKEGYPLMASLIPADTRRLLDLGCGTGLELDEIFKLYPDLDVTGVDMTAAMLDQLKAKHPDKKLTLICDDYFKADFGGTYDCAVSFETMHHFTQEKKIALYRRICEALTSDGVYIECDYMADTQEQEDYFFAELARMRAEQGIPEDVFVHYDTPCTIANQIAMLKDAGFATVEQVMRIGGTCMLVAKK